MQIQIRTFAALAIAALWGAGAAHAEPHESQMLEKSQAGIELSADVSWTMCAPDGVAIGGYDLLSYRQSDGPVIGNPEVSATHGRFTYWFSSEDNQSAFLANPERYLPAYSGFCAITLALGRATCPEFTNFKIEDDRLLLFEVTGFTNGRALWNSDATTFKKQADNNFDRLNALK